MSDLVRTRWVSILDCEGLNYMANSRYLFYMDLIRFEILFRSKLFENTYKKGVYAVLASQKIIYKKPLKRWDKFTITLVLEGWDDKYVYHKQVFKRNDETHAIGFTKLTFWQHKKALDMGKIILDCGGPNTNMPPSEEVLGLFKSDYDIIQKHKKDLI
ncbi:acyl-CoA thioesterase [Marinoscillum sp. MHG1-6]|uniref:acyl-CoA thioesterase n=1 Tax=Marinoscillum sp. MHG1-6 TaxID=2959627 RepID=UPI00215806F9|nr:acyl-CoA thioesterase [Marinoscillum sp. MHG1-6]